MEYDYLIDTHSHIDMLKDVSMSDIIKNASNNNVKKIVLPSVNRDSFDKVVELAQAFDEVYAALGIHPTEFDKILDSDFEKIEVLSKNNKVIAIGECGLDYYWDKSRIEEQKELFVRQIELAKKLTLPLLVHDREAHGDTYEILTKYINSEIPVVMHCFSGSVEFAKECVKKGFYIALGGVVTFKNAKKMKEVALSIPIEKLLLETDAPYLTPVPYRGKQNEPAYVKYVAEEIARIRGISFEEVAFATTRNACEVFKF